MQIVKAVLMIFPKPLLQATVKAPVSGHPREAEKVSATGAGRLRECINTEFVFS